MDHVALLELSEARNNRTDRYPKCSDPAGVDKRWVKGKMVIEFF